MYHPSVLDCSWSLYIGVREGLRQLNSEIVNVPAVRGYDLGEFCYCERLGYIESRRMEREYREYNNSGR